MSGPFLEELWVKNPKHVCSEGKDLRTLIHRLWLHLAGSNDYGKRSKSSCSRLPTTPSPTGPTSIVSVIEKEPGEPPQGPSKELSLSESQNDRGRRNCENGLY